MTDKPKPKIEKLELNRETIQDLTEEEAEGVQGGFTGIVTFKVTCPPTCAGDCTNDCPYQPHLSDGVQLDCVQRAR